MLYVDDSGTKEYSPPGKAYAANNPRYFVFGGVLISIVEAGLLTERIRTLKRVCLGAEDVEVKSNWLRMPRERERRYLHPYGLSEADLERFVTSYYDLIADADLTLIAGVVDKLHMQEDYPPSRWYAPAVAYEILLQRVENELCGKGRVSVVIDDMTGKTPKGNEYKGNLKRHHMQLIQRGSTLKKGFKFTCLAGLKFVSSQVSNLVQVADVVSYNVFRQFQDHGEAWEELGRISLPAYPYFARILTKFRQGPDGRIQGFGVVKFPLRLRVKWRVR